MERDAHAVFQSVVYEIRKNVDNSLRSIASGVLDMSGFDYLWVRMLARDRNVDCLSRPPSEYTPLKVNMDGALRTMCQQLIDNNCNSYRCGAIIRISPVAIPTEVNDASHEVQLQADAAHTLLEAL